MSLNPAPHESRQSVGSNKRLPGCQICSKISKYILKLFKIKLIFENFNYMKQSIIIKEKDDTCPNIKYLLNEQNVNFKKWLNFKVEFTEKHKTILKPSQLYVSIYIYMTAYIYIYIYSIYYV